MPKVGNKTFPYTPEGWRDAKTYAKEKRISRIQGAFSMKKYKQMQKEIKNAHSKTQEHSE